MASNAQWGFRSFSGTDYKKIDFTLPIKANVTLAAFSTGYDESASTFLWHTISYFNSANIGVTGFVYDSRYSFTGLGYIAICK